MTNKIALGFIIVAGFIINSCTSNLNNAELFDDITWYSNNKKVIVNDSCVSFTVFDTISQTLKNKQKFSIDFKDTTLVYTRFSERGYYNENREFITTHLEKLVDTVMYDLKYINKHPKLILYLDPFPVILSTDKELTLPETHNFKRIAFVISDYSVGDQIDRTLIKTRGIYNYPNYTIEDCEFIENKDITFKIIGYNTIYSIERKRIEDKRKKEVVDVVTKKLNTQPEYRPMRQWVEGADYEYEFYRWAHKGVQINLSRSKYIGTESYKKLVGKDDWTLSYDDSFTQALLVETYRNGNQKSSIIN